MGRLGVGRVGARLTWQAGGDDGEVYCTASSTPAEVRARIDAIDPDLVRLLAQRQVPVRVA